MDSVELRACPFCGRENVTIIEDCGIYRIHCVDCQIYFQKDGTCGRNYDKEKTVDAWNKRAGQNVLVSELGFSTRTLNCLYRAGCKTVGDVIALGEDGLMKVRNLGQGCLAEIKEKVGELK